MGDDRLGAGSPHRPGVYFLDRRHILSAALGLPVPAAALMVGVWARFGAGASRVVFILGLAGAVVSGLVGARMYASRTPDVTLLGDCVRILRPLRSEEISYSDIAAISDVAVVGRWGLEYQVVMIHLRDGRTRQVWRGTGVPLRPAVQDLRRL